jgi:hypothetical protein
MSASSLKPTKKVAQKAAKASLRKVGRTVRVLTLEERLEDMREHTREVCRTKASALAFLQRAGIVDASGALAEPFRT